MTNKDLVGIGFGPANLSLEIANREAGSPVLSHYYESETEFIWHSGMLLSTLRLQVSFLKDLITLSNPRSEYTFINYLHKAGRLNEFINLRTFYPSRIEYNLYYQWVAKQFNDKVSYQQKVTGISPIECAGEIRSLLLEIYDCNSCSTKYIETRNISVATGGFPKIPVGVDASVDNRICHSKDTLNMLKIHFPDVRQAYHFVIVGSGQTAADVFFYIISTYKCANVTIAMRGFAIKPQDDTHLINELFFPEAVDMWYNMPEPLKTVMFNRHKDVTHSSADIDMLEPIYDALYTDKVTGRNRLHMARYHDLKSTRSVDNEVFLTFQNLMTGEEVKMCADGAILATGYDRSTPLPLLDELSPWFMYDKSNYLIERNYAIKTNEKFYPRVYLPGYSEKTHGFTETLLSILPIRSVEILDDLRRTLPENV